MTPFEFVFFLYAIMLSLGLTQLLGGWAASVRNARAIEWSAPPIMWALVTLFYTTGNLTSFWLMRAAPDWSPGLVLGNFAFAIVNYVLCVFVTPDTNRGEILDLAAFHEQERRRYLAAVIALLVVAITNNVAIGLFAGYSHWWSDSVSSFVAIVPAACGIRWRNNIVQIASAATALLISGYFLIDSANIVAS
jgi:hypothetical protein